MCYVTVNRFFFLNSGYNKRHATVLRVKECFFFVVWKVALVNVLQATKKIVYCNDDCLRENKTFQFLLYVNKVIQYKS